jgi:hypothetical protein
MRDQVVVPIIVTAIDAYLVGSRSEVQHDTQEALDACDLDHATALPIKAA